MGKAEVLSNIGAGQYQIKLLYSQGKLTERLADIDSQIAALTEEIDSMEVGPAQEFIKLKRTSYEKQKEYLNDNMPEDPTVNIWCSDFTEDLTGNIGSIEIPGERNVVLIQPGYEDNAVYNSVRDGQLQPAIASKPATVFSNLARLPGWQKWKPTYRQGVISNLDGDTADVTLTNIKSTQQKLEVNQSDSLENVEIDYMDCNGGAFEDGDQVVVKFIDQDWTKPKIIGFIDNPKACGFQFKLTHGDGTIVDNAKLDYFKVYNSTGSLLTISEPTYNADTEFWSFNITGEPDENGYWINYNTDEFGLDTQYPFKYKDGDKQEEGDLIPIGVYEDDLPYWDNQEYEDSPPYTGSCATSNPDLFAIFRDTFTREKTIKSSIPYRVTHTINSNSASVIIHQHERSFCAFGGWNPDCSKPLTACAGVPPNGLIRTIAGTIDEVNPYSGSCFQDYNVGSSFVENTYNIQLSYLGGDYITSQCWEFFFEEGDCYIVEHDFEAEYANCNYYHGNDYLQIEIDYDF